MPKAGNKRLTSVNDRPSVGSRARILSAVVSLMLEEGLSSCTIDLIVQRTGVAKTTIYRYWPGRAELLDEAIDVVSASRNLPDTGDLLSDLKEFLITRGRPSKTIKTGADTESASILDSTGRDTHLARIARKVRERAHSNLVSLLARGQGRGELRQNVDIDTLADMLMGAIHVRSALMGKPLTVEYIDSMIRAIL